MRNYILVWLFFISIGLISSNLLIMHRIDLAYRLQYDPTTMNNIVYDMASLEEFAFFTDELYYYNYRSRSGSFGDISYVLSSMWNDRLLRNTNIFGVYIQTLRTITGSWELLFFFSGILSLTVFSVILSAIFGDTRKESVIVFLVITLSPICLQIASSWLRDLFIASVMLGSILAASRGKYFIWFIMAFLMLLLRGYMLPITLIALIIFGGNDESSTKLKIISSVSLIVGIIFLFLYLYGTQYSLSMLFNEFLPRIVQNFSGMTYGFFKGQMPTPRGNLADTEVYGYYYYIVTYILCYINIYFHRFNIAKSKVSFKWFFFSILSGIYITILHSATAGYFSNRVIFLTWVPMMITTVKTSLESSAPDLQKTSSLTKCVKVTEK